MSDVPDPIELRKKLGIGPKTVARPTIHDFEKQHPIGELAKVSVTHGKGMTLADFEPEPREIDEAESAKITELLRNCPPAAGKWLKKYLILGNMGAASRAINYSAGTVKWWRDHHPEFGAMLAFYQEEIRLRWNEVAERRALEGFKDEVFKPDGSLKYTRMRQDPHFMKEMMKRLDPDWRDSDSGTQINIVVSRSEE